MHETVIIFTIGEIMVILMFYDILYISKVLRMGISYLSNKFLKI